MQRSRNSPHIPWLWGFQEQRGSLHDANYCPTSIWERIHLFLVQAGLWSGLRDRKLKWLLTERKHPCWNTDFYWQDNIDMQIRGTLYLLKSILIFQISCVEWKTVRRVTSGHPSSPSWVTALAEAVWLPIYQQSQLDSLSSFTFIPSLHLIPPPVVLSPLLWSRSSFSWNSHARFSSTGFPCEPLHPLTSAKQIPANSHMLVARKGENLHGLGARRKER